MLRADPCSGLHPTHVYPLPQLPASRTAMRIECHAPPSSVAGIRLEPIDAAHMTPPQPPLPPHRSSASRWPNTPDRSLIANTQRQTSSLVEARVALCVFFWGARVRTVCCCAAREAASAAQVLPPLGPGTFIGLKLHLSSPTATSLCLSIDADNNKSKSHDCYTCPSTLLRGGAHAYWLLARRR